MRRGLRSRSSHEPAQGGGTRIIVQGGGAPDDANPEGGRQRPKVGVQDVNAFAMRLISRYGSAENALEHIAGEQLKYRRRAQDAEAAFEDLQAKMPAAGAVVLTGDDAKAFQELKTKFPTVKVTDLSTQLTKLGELEAKDSRMTRENTLKLAAGTTYKPKVLAKLVGDTPIEFKTVMQRGDDDSMIETKVPYVKVGDTLEPLDAWLKREHEDWLDVVTVDDDEAGEGERGGRESAGRDREDDAGTRRESTAGARMPKAPVSGNGSGPKGKASDILKTVDRGLSAYRTPSQLRKEAAGGDR